MLNDLHRPLLVAVMCIPLLAGLAVTTLFGRVIAAMRTKQPLSADGILFHLVALAVLLAITALLALRTWHMPNGRQFLGLNCRRWRFAVIITFALGLLLGFPTTFMG